MKNMNPTLRGFLIIVVVAAAITAAGAEAGLEIVLDVLGIIFIIAIGYVVYSLWRRNREEISTWRIRSRAVFYGAAALAIVNLLSRYVLTYPSNGLEGLVFFVIFAACAFAMWRVWRDEHTYA
jgi:small-conductance mechanosensitive channel